MRVTIASGISILRGRLPARVCGRGIKMKSLCLFKAQNNGELDIERGALRRLIKNPRRERESREEILRRGVENETLMPRRWRDNFHFIARAGSAAWQKINFASVRTKSEPLSGVRPTSVAAHSQHLATFVTRYGKNKHFYGAGILHVHIARSGSQCRAALAEQSSFRQKSDYAPFYGARLSFFPPRVG
jgi:hypothetical protein